MMQRITLSLVSHTNVGKTTLARTLLKKDVGEVLDQAHITVVTEEHTLIAAGDARLALWDTPGFGDTARLVKRIRNEGNPIGWFLHEIWDRAANRPLWCSQQAIRNIQTEADVVLYLVNASENPADAGYLPHELQILTWIGRPTIFLLNQVGSPAGADFEALNERWKAYAKAYPIVRDVLPMDAFTRCWVEESLLLERVAAHVPREKAEAMRSLTRAFENRHLEALSVSVAAIAAHLWRTASDRVALSTRLAGKGEKRTAMEALAERARRSTEAMMTALIAAHGLDGASSVTIEDSIRNFSLPSSPSVSPRKGALLGSVVSGAVTGLVADVLSGGLSFGGGVVAGMIGGALAGAGLAKGFELAAWRGEPAVLWSKEWLEDAVRDALSRYLAVAHFGRGRGGFRDLELPPQWAQVVAEECGRSKPALARVFAAAQSGKEDSRRLELKDLVAASIRTILRRLYPRAAELLG